MGDYASRSRDVLDFFLSNTYGISQDVEYAITDGADDGGLDAYVVDHTKKSVTLIQCKWYDQEGTSVGKDETRELWSFYMNDLVPNKGDKLRDEIVIFIRRFNSMYKDHSIEFEFVTNGLVGTEDASVYRPELQVVGPDALAGAIYDHLSEIEPVRNEVTLSIPDEKFFELETTDQGQIKTLQCQIRARDLVDSYLRYQDKLLSRNLRLLLTGKINRQILETAQDPEHRPLFYLLHNGISIVCDDYEWKADQGKGRILVLTNAQIVNGGQSTATVSKVDPIIIGDMSFPCKITAPSNTDIARAIAIANNTQNAIKPLDLISNDEELVFMQNYAASMIDPPIFFKRKSGREKWEDVRFSRQRPKPSKVRTFHYKAAAQALLAFVGHPAKAYSSPTPYITPPGAFYRRIVTYPDPSLIMAAGLLSNYEKRESSDPEFCAYWKLWAIAAVGHIYSYIIDEHQKKEVLKGILSERGQEIWKHPMRTELKVAFEEVFKKYYPGLQYKETYLMQGFFKGQEEVFGLNRVVGIQPKDVQPFVRVSGSSLQDIKRAEKSGFDRYETEFAVFAVALKKEIEGAMLDRFLGF